MEDINEVTWLGTHCQPHHHHRYNTYHNNTTQINRFLYGFINLDFDIIQIKGMCDQERFLDNRARQTKYIDI